MDVFKIRRRGVAASGEAGGWAAMASDKLVMTGISKSFGRTVALDNVDFFARPGEIHTLMGENGAGKSTLMKMLIGLYRPDAGRILLDGEEVSFTSPREALSHGIAMIHQELYPILDMTVADNIFLGREIRSAGFGPLSLVDRRRSRAKAEELLADMGLSIPPDAHMRDISVAETQLVEIVKAVSQGADVIIMDEPTSAITEREIEHLFAHMDRLKRSGAAIIFISHKLDEIFRVSDVITVLRDGNLVESRPAADLTRESLVKLMVGREVHDIYPPKAGRGGAEAGGRAALEVSGLADRDKFRDVGFVMRHGEILGMAGLMGAGRTEVAECLFGLNPRTAGEIRINGVGRNIGSPRDAIACGMALVSDDRKQKGLNLEATVGENVSLLRLRSFSRFGVIDERREGRAVEQYMARLGVKAESPDAPVASLSGGNQQKVVLAKWFMSEPDIIIFDEPTRGIDVGAKHEIYLLIDELARQGKAVLMISSEMNEIIGMADRVIVMAEGRLRGELVGERITQEAIMTLSSNLDL